MVFSTVESSITKSGQALGIFKKDWHDVVYDIQHTSGITNKIKAAFSTSISSFDAEKIRDYNAEIRNGVSSQTAFNRCMLKTSSAAQNLVASAKLSSSLMGATSTNNSSGNASSVPNKSCEITR